MKKFWKVLGAAALVASVIPYKVEQDLETGEKTYDALLWQLKLRHNQEEDRMEKELSILPCRCPSKAKKEEAELFEDENCWCCSTPVEEAANPCEDVPF